MSQEQIRKPTQGTQTPAEVAADLPAKDVDADKVKADLDDLMDEIDDVLEENAEEFVANYIQKGGQ